MSLPWVRLDTSMPDHPKIVKLCDERGDAGMAAAFVWCCSLAYSGKHGTDGLIPRGTLSRINGKAKHAKLLVDYRLWDIDPEGWRIHGWEEYQFITLDVEAFTPQARSNGGRARAASMTPEERSAAASKAAQARWNGGGDAY